MFATVEQRFKFPVLFPEFWEQLRDDGDSQSPLTQYYEKKYRLQAQIQEGRLQLSLHESQHFSSNVACNPFLVPIRRLTSKDEWDMVESLFQGNLAADAFRTNNFGRRSSFGEMKGGEGERMGLRRGLNPDNYRITHIIRIEHPALWARYFQKAVSIVSAYKTTNTVVQELREIAESLQMWNQLSSQSLPGELMQLVNQMSPEKKVAFQQAMAELRKAAFQARGDALKRILALAGEKYLFHGTGKYNPFQVSTTGLSTKYSRGGWLGKVSTSFCS